MKKIDIPEPPEDFDWIFLNSFKQRFDDGDKNAVMGCLRYCLSAKPRIAIPAWAADAFNEITLRVYECEIGSWDEAFGRPHPKNTNLTYQRDLYKNRLACHRAVEVARASGEAVDDAFISAGKKLGMSWQTVRAHYYFVKKIDRLVDTRQWDELQKIEDAQKR
jgi:hypothetical protein